MSKKNVEQKLGDMINQDVKEALDCVVIHEEFAELAASELSQPTERRKSPARKSKNMDDKKAFPERDAANGPSASQIMAQEVLAKVDHVCGLNKYTRVAAKIAAGIAMGVTVRVLTLIIAEKIGVGRL